MELKNNRLTVGDLTITFQRTLRLPEDGKTHALPPGLGAFPLKRVDDYLDKVPASWKEHGGVFLPMYQREAMWLSFSPSEVCAVKVACGKINAVSGQPWKEELSKPREVSGKDPEQDYMVCPTQPWLDGFNTGDNVIRQFVAMPLGMGYTVEGQVTGEEKHGGIQIKVFKALPGKVPTMNRGGHYYAASGSLEYNSLDISEDYYMPVYAANSGMRSLRSASVKGAEMGLAAGGKMTQKIYEDPYGFDVWDQNNSERVFVHIVNSTMWKEITREAPPDSPVNAHTYTQYGYPWFEIYDENLSAVQGSGTLANVKPVSEKDAEHGFIDQQDDSTLDESKNIKKIGKKHPINDVRDGKW